MSAPGTFDAWRAVDRTTRIRLIATLVEERAGDDANTTVETFPSIVAAMRIIKNEAGTLDDEIEEAFRPTYSGNGHGADVQVRQAIEAVSARLGNTPAVCRKCYVHPEVIDSYMAETLVLELKDEVAEELSGDGAGLRPEEALVLAFLHQRLDAAA